MKNEKEKVEKSQDIKSYQEKQKIPLPKFNSFNDKKYKKNKQISYELNDFSKENKILSSIFFKKYKPLKILGEGTFSVVYEGINIIDKTKVALKIEDKNAKIPLLEKEAFSIFNLQGYGIIKFISFGHSKDYNILVEPLLGKSLYTLYLESKKSFTLKDICFIAIQCLERIEHIHSKGYIHGDIKPENFLIGLNDPRIIYIIDFGLSKKFRSDRTGNHIQFCITKKMTGTARYASTNSLRGVQISRRDDLESLAYMILYFIMKKLPWQGVKATTQQNRYKKIYYIKKKLIEYESFKDLPNEIQNFYKNIKKLNFKEEPNYALLKGYFKDLLAINNFQEDDNFSWVNNKFLIDTKNEINLKKRKSNSLKRLMDKLMKNSTCDFEENQIKTINNSKNSLSKERKNITIKNDFIYSSNNKEIKSINEAIIDVGDFSDNEEENKINNLLQKDIKLIRKNNSEIKKKNLLISENNNIDKYIMKEFDINNNIAIFNNNIIENNKNNIYEHEIRKYTSFNKRNTYAGNGMNNNIKIEKKNNFERCIIGKDYIRNEMRKNINCKNNIDVNDKNKGTNLKNEIDKKEKVNKSYPKNINNRSNSGDKCLIQ